MPEANCDIWSISRNFEALLKAVRNQTLGHYEFTIILQVVQIWPKRQIILRHEEMFSGQWGVCEDKHKDNL